MDLGCVFTVEVQKHPYEVTTKYDAVAMAHCAYREFMGIEYTERWPELTQITPTEYDFLMAEKIKKYYLDRYTVRALKGQPITKIQALMSSILRNEPMMSDKLGILYKIPYFYYEDTTLSGLMERYTSITETGKMYDLLAYNPIDLKPVTEILVSRKGGDNYQYWFEAEDNALAMIEVAANNSLRTLIKSLSKKDEITLRAHRFVNHQRLNLEFFYWKLGNLEFV